MPDFVSYKGLVYRAHNPRWPFKSDSGEGAKLKGGRFNPKGIKALYTSLTFQTAWTEAQQGFPQKTQPQTLCCYQVNCEHIVDLTSQKVRTALHITYDDLRSSWLIKSPGENSLPPSQHIAMNLREQGAAGILVNSFANNAQGDDINLVFFKWGDALPHQVKVIDDFDRLPHNQHSWTSSD